MKNALKRIQEVNNEYAKFTGRSYGNGLIDAYKLEDAEIAVVCVGSTSGTLKVIVDELRQEGIKAGLLRLRTFQATTRRRTSKSIKQHHCSCGYG